MELKTLKIKADNATITAANHYEVWLEIGKAEADFLDQITAEQICSVVDQGSLLDAIGEKACIKHFGIEVAEK